MANSAFTQGSLFPAYKISKRPTFGRRYPSELATHFGANRFVPALRAFLARRVGLRGRGQGELLEVDEPEASGHAGARSAAAPALRRAGG